MLPITPGTLADVGTYTSATYDATVLVALQLTGPDTMPSLGDAPLAAVKRTLASDERTASPHTVAAEIPAGMFTDTSVCTIAVVAGSVDRDGVSDGVTEDETLDDAPIDGDATTDAETEDDADSEPELAALTLVEDDELASDDCETDNEGVAETLELNVAELDSAAEADTDDVSVSDDDKDALDVRDDDDDVLGLAEALHDVDADALREPLDEGELEMHEVSPPSPHMYVGVASGRTGMKKLGDRPAA